MYQASFEPRFDFWRAEARRFVQAQVRPEEALWRQDTDSLLGGVPLPEELVTKSKVVLKVPVSFLNIAKHVASSNEIGKWDLLYRLLYRLHFENTNLLQIHVDPDVRKATVLAKSVSHDIHKMHAFVRFKKTEMNGEEAYMAWHKPEHPCLRMGAEFFVRRFGDKPWSIFTPDESAHWNLETLTFGEGMPQHEFLVTDEWDELWKTYYRSIFNPARIKMKAMKKDMAPKYWQSMPETALISELIREAPARLEKMAEHQNQAAVVDPKMSLPELREAAKSCQACPLASRATQTVFGEGPANAELMIVGEQPGDQEDVAGRVFVGPAGQLLNDILAEIQMDRSQVYVTNAVKHFKWEANDKMRLHKKASGSEQHACRPWLDAEINQIKPNVIVALGATSGTMLLGRLPKMSEDRGKIFTGRPTAPALILSWHPSAILRARTPEDQAKMRAELKSDLSLALRAQVSLRQELPGIPQNPENLKP